MPSADPLIAFLGVSILLGLTPGPDNIFVLLQSAQRGWRAGMAVHTRHIGRLFVARAFANLPPCLLPIP